MSNEETSAVMDDRTARYAQALQKMIKHETVSSGAATDDEKFHSFRALMRELFPHIFALCEVTEFESGIVMKWQGSDPDKEPVLFMNHHDVVAAEGEWSHAPFSGDIAEGRLWGRGTLDDKGGLWAMLQAADDLAKEGFMPGRTIWFESSSTEETTGKGADEISQWFMNNGIRFKMCFDEGGVILHEPIAGADADFALIGVGEKGCADIKFTARSNGGHASIPEKDSPLVRLGKFMAEADKHSIFKARMDDTICEMLRCFAPYCDGVKAKFMAEPEKHRGLLTRKLISASPKTAAMLRTTMSFTMAEGSKGTNIIPSEAWVIGNMRCSHHQGRDASIEAARKLAAKYDIETEVLDPGQETAVTDYRGEAYRLAAEAVKTVFPGTVPAPYIMTGASDSRFFRRVCDQCICFLPFKIDDAQLDSIHAIDENVCLGSLAPAVDFYRCLMKGSQ